MGGATYAVPQTSRMRWVGGWVGEGLAWLVVLVYARQPECVGVGGCGWVGVGGEGVLR